MKKYWLFFLLVCFSLALSACGKLPEQASPKPDGSAAPFVQDSGTRADVKTSEEDSVAFSIGNEPVYNSEFNFHVVSQINSYSESEEGKASGFDPKLPLSEQHYPDSDVTMEEIFKQGAIEDLHHSIAVYLEAKANGYVMGEWEKESINSFFSSLDAYIKQEGATEEEVYLKKYGIKMSHEQVNNILERGFISTAYEKQLQSGTVYSDEELKAFYEQHKNEVIIPDCTTASLRLINFTSGQTAQDVMQKFERGDKSESSFIDLVKTYSTDKQDIESGGLFTDLSPKNYKIESFDEVESWIFDRARNPGDYSLLKTDNGYELAYFVAKGEPLWKRWSRFAKTNEEIQRIVDKYPISYPGGQ